MNKNQFLISIIITVFVILNIAYSQNISSLFIKIALNKDISAFTDYYLLTKDDPLLKKQNDFLFEENKNLKKEIEKIEQKQQLEIEEYNKILAINPESTDILIKISEFYFNNQNTKKALEYYSKAKTIDPNIKIAVLEKL